MNPLEIYRFLLKIRLVEEKISFEYHNDEMKTPMHLYIGQEAIATGVCLNLEKKDLVFSNHRSHGHYIAKGGDIKAMFAEFFCRQNGCSGGYGGSMHLVDKENGLPGSSAIVGGSIPIGVGAAFSFKYRSEKNICAIFFGDGAADEGVLYESINFATLHNLPVFFICENNEWSVNSHHSSRHKGNICDRFKNIIPCSRVDGNDVEEVNSVSNKIIEDIRNGKGPHFMECLTFRMKDHCGSESNPMVSEKTLQEWKDKCPIKKYREKLFSTGNLKDDLNQKIVNEINSEIEEAFNYGKNDSFPKKNKMLEMIYF